MSKSTVWYAIPSIRSPEEAMPVLEKWRALGYKVAVQRDEEAAALEVDLCIHRPYEGYAKAVNRLAEIILRGDPDCDFVVTGGDDVLCDPTHDPATIAAECTEHFGGTLGVMQPTGDKFMTDADGLCAAERVCISPWMGRAWCQRAHEGRGPMWHEYVHNFVDEDLQNVALKHGVLWHRPDLNQHHAWYGRTGKEKPEHLVRADAGWDEAKTLFESRQAAGFPGSGLL